MWKGPFHLSGCSSLNKRPVPVLLTFGYAWCGCRMCFRQNYLFYGGFDTTTSLPYRPFQCVFAPCTSYPSNAISPRIACIRPIQCVFAPCTSDPSNAFPTRIHRLATSVLIKHVLLLFSQDLQTCNKSFRYSSKAYPSDKEAICGLTPSLWPAVPLIL